MNSVFNFLGTTVIPKQVENKSYAKLKGGGGWGKEGVLWEMSKCRMENGSTIKCKEKRRFGFACQSPDSQIPKRTRYPFFKIIVHNLNGLFNF